MTADVSPLKHAPLKPAPRAMPYTSGWSTVSGPSGSSRWILGTTST
ncbi:hypothetical protein [Planotetraspora sp. GP83]